MAIALSWPPIENFNVQDGHMVSTWPKTQRPSQLRLNRSVKAAPFVVASVFKALGLRRRLATSVAEMPTAVEKTNCRPGCTRYALAMFFGSRTRFRSSGGRSDPKACGSKLSGLMDRACHLAQWSPWDCRGCLRGLERTGSGTLLAYPDVASQGAPRSERFRTLQLELWWGGGPKPRGSS